MSKKLVLSKDEEQMILNFRQEKYTSKIPAKEFDKFGKEYVELSEGICFSKKVPLKIDISIAWEEDLFGSINLDRDRFGYSDIYDAAEKAAKEELKIFNLRIKVFMKNWKAACKKYKADEDREWDILTMKYS